MVDETSLIFNENNRFHLEKSLFFNMFNNKRNKNLKVIHEYLIIFKGTFLGTNNIKFVLSHVIL